MSAYDALPPDFREQAKALIQRIFEADDALDVPGFLAVLDPDAIMHIGSQPPIEGHAAIQKVIEDLFSGLSQGIRHTLLKAWSSDDTLVYQAEARFFLKNGHTATLPYVNVLKIASNGLILDYRIYIDFSALRPPTE